MVTTKEIEAAIGALPRTEFLRLYDQLRSKHSELWDQEMVDDAKTGEPLDLLAEKALAEFEAGKTKRLP